ncbi:MAG: efflux RND transporter periplasmic adaptor subunit [Planctomycetales bacterium]
MRNRIAWHCLVWLTGVVLVEGWSTGAVAEEAKKEEAKAKPPATHTVRTERLRIELSLSGTLESEHAAEISLRPRVWNKLEVKLAKDHGAVVKKGEQLVELDLQDLKRAIKAAEQALTVSRLGLDEAKVALDAQRKTTPMSLAAAERDVKNAKDDLQYYLDVDRDQSIKGAERSLKGSQYSLEYATEELNQLRQMYKADDLTEETEEIILKRAERSVESAAFSLESAKIRTARTLKTAIPRREVGLKESTNRESLNLDKAVISLTAGLKKAEIGFEKQRIEFAQAEENLAELKADLKMLSEIRSPVDGFVYFGRVQNGKWSGKGTHEAELQPGGVIAAKKVFMTIVSPKVVRVRTSVSEKDLFQVRAGITGHGTATAYPDSKVSLKVSSVGRIPSAPGQFDCVIDLVDAFDSLVVAGMSCKILLTTYDQPEALTVPAASVHSDKGNDESYVYVVDGAENVRRTVKTGRKDDGQIEIVDGLKVGDEVLLKKPEGE